MQALIEKLEQATAGSSALDWEIFAALNPQKSTVIPRHRYLFGEAYTTSFFCSRTPPHA